MPTTRNAQYRKIAIILIQRAEAYHYATSAPQHTDRIAYRTLAEQLDTELLLALASPSQTCPAKPKRLVMPDGSVRHLQREKGRQAWYVTAENYDPDNVILNPETALQRLLGEMEALDVTEGSTEMIAAYEALFGSAQEQRRDEREIAAVVAGWSSKPVKPMVKTPYDTLEEAAFG